MELEKITALLGPHRGKPVECRIKRNDGTSRVTKLWLLECGEVYLRGRKKKRTYYPIWREYENWASVSLVTHKEIDYRSRVEKRCQKALKHLTESGFWPDLKECIEAFMSMPEKERQDFIDLCVDDYYENVYKVKEEKFPWLTFGELFPSLMGKECFKTIPWTKYSKGYQQMILDESIKEGKDYCYKFRNGYDITVEFYVNDGVKRGWLSLEYVGCGNGHYYLLLDSKHAIYYEDD